MKTFRIGYIDSRYLTSVPYLIYRQVLTFWPSRVGIECSYSLSKKKIIFESLMLGPSIFVAMEINKVTIDNLIGPSMGFEDLYF